MSIEYTGLAIEIIRSAVLIISIIYLGKQVKNGAKNLKTTTRNASFHSLMEWNYRILSDEDLAVVFFNGCQDFESLTEAQKPRYMLLMYSFFKVFENIYMHYLDESVDSNVWDNNNQILKTYFLTPGAQFYWNARKMMMHPDFVKFLEGIKTSDMEFGQDIIDKNRAKANQ